MAIQMRRGNLVDFDPSKMLAGEWAVSTDSDTERQQVYMCFAPSIVKRMATYDDFKPYFYVDLEPTSPTYGHLMFGLTENYEFKINATNGHLEYQKKGA